MAAMHSAVVAPDIGTERKVMQHDEYGHLYHVVLLDDDEHTYDYVIEMLQKLFFLASDDAMNHAIGIGYHHPDGGDHLRKGRGGVREGSDPLILGADPRMPKSKGSMSAIVIPASNTKTQ